MIKFFLPDIDPSEFESREGLHVEIRRSPDRRIGWYAAVYNKFGYQLSDTKYGFRKRDLKDHTIEDFTIGP